MEADPSASTGLQKAKSDIFSEAFAPLQQMRMLAGLMSR